MTSLPELQQIIDQIGRENIWRPVFNHEHEAVFDGVGTHRDYLDETLGRHEFNNKSVLDLGCNLGYYSFLAERLGCRRVVGLDINPLMIRGCEILKKYYGLKRCSFMVADFTGDCGGEQGDIGLLLDFIGKNVIKKQKLAPVLLNLKNLIRSELHISLHTEYDIERDLKMGIGEFSLIYPDRFIKNNRFQLLDYVLSVLDTDWRLDSTISGEHLACNHKYPLHLVRKTSENQP
ncbi:MAG: class I SAM-dependent methyltransferase [Thermodesulfobacteriota bacterium]